jgi:hypothetical protein
MRTVRLGRTADVLTCLGNSLAYVHDNQDSKRSSGPSQRTPTLGRFFCSALP